MVPQTYEDQAVHFKQLQGIANQLILIILFKGKKLHQKHQKQLVIQQK